jgi:hypothetical protein
LGLVKSFPDYASRDWTGDKEGWGFVFELLKGIHRERDKLKTQVKYERLFPEIVDVARQHGYVIGLHGSLQRDCDLIAVPWTFPVKTPDELIEAIREKVGGTLESSEDGRERSLKPWGRIAWSIQVGGGRYLDVSVFQLDVNRVYLEAHEEKALRQMAEVKLKQQAAELAELRAVVERATSAVDHTGQVTGMCFGSPTAAESTPSNPATPRWSGCGRRVMRYGNAARLRGTVRQKANGTLSTPPWPTASRRPTRARKERGSDEKTADRMDRLRPC